jgi:hypothetical protein
MQVRLSGMLAGTFASMEMRKGIPPSGACLSLCRKDQKRRL